MLIVGIVVSLVGYQFVYYGYNTITGGNDPFLSLLWPGRYKPTARDK